MESNVIRTSFTLERDEFHPFKGVCSVEYLAVPWTKSAYFSSVRVLCLHREPRQGKMKGKAHLAIQSGGPLQIQCIGTSTILSAMSPLRRIFG